jgi:hypothetical protein
MDKKEEIALSRMRKSVQKLGGSTEVYTCLPRNMHHDIL